MDILAVLGDALWILALAIMSGASRQALKRVVKGARAYLLGLRLPAPVALCLVPAVALLVSLWLGYVARMPGTTGDLSGLVLGARALTASLFALLHLRALSLALKVLGREGQLKS